MTALLLCGIPQSSVLSPFLFNFYMKPLGKIICYNGMKYLQCTDDTQVYIFIPGDTSDAVAVVSWCLEAVGGWMGDNLTTGVWLNPGKTEWPWVYGALG